MSSYYSYQNSLNKYENLLEAYKVNKADTLSSKKLKEINRKLDQQEKQAIGLGAGLPLSLTVATSFLKTKGSKALLAKLGKKAFFIPTPGQFEQEYLAKRLFDGGFVPYCKQDDFSIDKLETIKDYKGLENFDYEVNFKRLFSLF